MKKKYLFFNILIIIVVFIITYFLYISLFGVNVNLVMKNNSNYVVQTDSINNNFLFNDFESIDFKIIVNDEVVFFDTVSNKEMFGKKIGLKLNPGWNYVEVYSDKAKLYSVNSSYIFLKKKYYVTFSNYLWVNITF